MARISLTVGVPDVGRRNVPSTRPRKKRAAMRPLYDVTKPGATISHGGASSSASLSLPCRVVITPHRVTMVGRRMFGPTRWVEVQR